MITVQFSEIIWNAQFAQFNKDDTKTYNLIHLNLAEETSKSDGIRTYTVIHNRTSEPICELLVSEFDEQDFRSFQNALLSSKL